MQVSDSDQYLCPAEGSGHPIIETDAVIICLPRSWSPVKDKETPGARLTLRDRL